MLYNANSRGGCNRGCQGRSRYAALRQARLYPDINYDYGYPRRDPFYRGPCPPACSRPWRYDPCHDYHCDPCDDHHDHCDDHDHWDDWCPDRPGYPRPPWPPRPCAGEYGFFAAAQPVQLPEGGTVALRSVGPVCGMRNRRDGIELCKTGTYYICYTVHVPKNTQLEATFRLRKNRQAIPGSEVFISKDSYDETLTCTGQAIVDACECDLIALYVDQPLNYTMPGFEIITLCIVRIC